MKAEALRELIEKLKAGGPIQPFTFQDALNHNDHPRCAGEAIEAYNGSLDAVKALHEAVLPGWSWFLADDGSAAVFLGEGGPRFDAEVKDDPARALLLADLYALLSEAEG